MISEYATANLDLSQPFIDVVPEREVKDRKRVRAIVESNRTKSIERRREIRDFARRFDWERVIDRYCAAVADICGGPLK